jgi:protein arginine kinase activator
MMDLFSELFDMFDSMDVFNQPSTVRGDNHKCPVCGHTWSDFNATGKFGCGECYKTFGEGAERVMRQVHSSSRHVGKVPSKSGAQLKAKRHLEELKRQLKEAVNNEEYEKAAKLHSEIKSLENQGGASK